MSHVWYISTRHLRNPLQNRLAHVIGEHMGYGSYRTLCSKNVRLLVDYRERVDISKLPEKAICPRCRKLIKTSPNDIDYSKFINTISAVGYGFGEYLDLCDEPQSNIAITHPRKNWKWFVVLAMLKVCWLRGEITTYYSNNYDLSRRPARKYTSKVVMVIDELSNFTEHDWQKLT